MQLEPPSAAGMDLAGSVARPSVAGTPPALMAQARASFQGW